MAKGLAVISGSNNVVFKVLETGTIQAGTATTAATFTLTGSLLISGSTEPVLQLQGLTLTATSSVANDTILIKNGDFVRQATVLSGNQVVLADGTNIETKINSLEANLGAQVLTVSGAEGTFAVDLESDQLAVVGTANEVTVALSDAGTKTTFTVGLPDAVEISSSLIITGSNLTDVLKITSGNIKVLNGAISGSGKLEIGGDISGSSKLYIEGQNASDSITLANGNVKVVNGQVSSSGDIYTNAKVVAAGEITGSSNLRIAGSGFIGTDLTVAGNLTVDGNVTVLDTTNLRVEDPIIVLGSGSAAKTTGDKGFVFVTSDAANQAFIWDGQVNKFILGSTLDDGTGININVTSSAAATSTLLLHTLSASNLEATGDVVLGNAGTDSLTINSYITGSGSPIVVSSSLTIGAANNVDTEITTFVSQVRMPIFSVAGGFNVSTFPTVPSLYSSNAAGYSGHMFYLTSSDGTNNAGDGNWDHANKWYFNERGVWHEMPFFFAPG